MNHSRSIGVAEARVGLTVLTCLLVALGYVVLQRLGVTGQTPLVENRQFDNVAEQITPEPLKSDSSQQPEVVQLEGTDLPSTIGARTPLRPQRPPRQ